MQSSSNGSGSVLVTGGGSVWSNQYDLSMAGELTIADSGAVFNNNVSLDAEQGALVVVTGTGSLWSILGILSIDGAFGGLTITNGGQVVSGSVEMHNMEDFAIVAGTGSVWNVAGELDVSGDYVDRVTIAAGGIVNVSGSAVLRNGGEIAISSGGLYVTNGLGTISMGFDGGTLFLNGGTVTADQLLVIGDDGGSSFVFTSGFVASGGTYVTNGENFVVGDGTDGAIFALVGGFHSFANGLTISSNAVLTGCGTIDGSVVVDYGGKVRANCGGTLDFTGSVTNNGIIRVRDGTTLNFYGPVVNNGVIVARKGHLRFWSGVQNNGKIVPRRRDPHGRARHDRGD